MDEERRPDGKFLSHRKVEGVVENEPHVFKMGQTIMLDEKGNKVSGFGFGSRGK